MGARKHRGASPDSGPLTPARTAHAARARGVTRAAVALDAPVTGRLWPRFHALLEAFGGLSGVPVLLNTSFNVRGEPVVCAPGAALDALLRTGLSAVVIGDLPFEKPKEP